MAAGWDVVQTIEEASAALTVCGCRGMGFMVLDLPTHHKLFGRAIPCVCRRDRRARERAKELMRRSGIGDNELEAYRFEKYQTSRAVIMEGQEPSEVRNSADYVKRICMHYATEPTGWLLLVGGFGVGKTHLAYAIAREQLQRGHAVYASSVPAMLRMLRAAYADDVHEEMLDWVQNVRLLVLDDWGTERGTDWARETLYQIVDYRYRNKLATVITANTRPDEDGVTDERLLSRMLDGSDTGGLSHVLEMNYGDYRRRKREALMAVAKE